MQRHSSIVILVLAAASTFGQSAANSSSTDPVPIATIADAHKKLEFGQAQEAIDILQKLAAAQPPTKGVHRELGIAYYRIGKLNDAQGNFAQALEEDASDSESVQLLGLTLYRLGRPMAAIPYLEQARQWNSNAGVDINYVLGRCYIEAHKYDDARSAIAAQYGIDPASGGAYLLMAQILVSEDGELPEIAAQNAQQALQISPNLPLAHFLLGKVSMSKGDTSRALLEFEKERAINPAYPPIYEFLGDLYSRTGQYRQAQQALTKAISLEQNSTGPYILMGKVFLDDNDPQTAATYLEHAEQMDPGNEVTHSLLGQAYRSMGRRDDAKREFEILAKIHSGTRLQLHSLQ